MDAEERTEKYVEIQGQILTETNKHFRRFYDDELENNKEIFPEMPFSNIDIFRGQSRGL
jgi:hypothetical protein